MYVLLLYVKTIVPLGLFSGSLSAGTSRTGRTVPAVVSIKPVSLERDPYPAVTYKARAAVSDLLCSLQVWFITDGNRALAWS